MAKNKKIKEFLAQFHIAGFAYYDGAEAFEELKIGLELELKLEEDNRYDPHAVAIYYEDFKLGFIPKEENDIFYKLLRVKSKNLKVRVQRLRPQEHPEQQIWVVAHLVEE